MSRITKVNIAGQIYNLQDERLDTIKSDFENLKTNVQQFTVSSNETVNKFFKELYVVPTKEGFSIEELSVNTISRNKLASDGVRHYWGINFIRKDGTKPLYFLSYDNPESTDVLEFDLTEDGKSAKMYAVVDWTAIEEGTQFSTGRNIPLKYWDDLKFSPYISAYINSNTGSDNGDEPIKFIDSNNYSTVFKELYIDSFSSKIYHKEEGKNIDTYLEDIPLDKVDLQINRIQRKILSSSSGNDVWGVVFRIKLPVYETRDGKNYIVRDENGEVQYTRNADFFFNMYEEENGVIDKNISLSSVLREDNGEYRYYTYRMKFYAVIDWSQIKEGTSATFNPKNILDAAYEINNSPQIKEYIEEKESYLPIKVDAKATLNLTYSNRIMLYGASMCSNSYPWFKEWLEKYTGAEVFNAGNPGWSAKRVASTTYYDKVAQINPDVIYIMLGGNDKGDDVGTFGAISTQTLVEEIPLTESWSDAEANDKDYKFIQSLDYILRKLKSEYYDINDNPKDDKRFPYIVVGTFTPQHREGYSMIEYNDPQNWLNKRNAAVECANKNNIPCLDVFSNIGIDWDEEPYYNQDLDYVNGKPTLVNRGIYTLDGLHLNEYGFERLARLVSGVFVPSNSGLKTIEWSESFNLDDYTTQGVYYIGGERTSTTDNLPIMNASPGHTISGQLTVLDASLSDAEQCVTQYLKLTNRTGSEGKEYIRTYNKYANGEEGWSAWKELQGTTYLGQVTKAQLDTVIDNGIYTGVVIDRELLPRGSTFTLIVLNNYDANSAVGMPAQARQVSQTFIYLPLADVSTGTIVPQDGQIIKRTGVGDTIINWLPSSDLGEAVFVTQGYGHFAINADSYNKVFIAGGGPGTVYLDFIATKDRVIDIFILHNMAAKLVFTVNGSAEFSISSNSYKVGLYKLGISLSNALGNKRAVLTYIEGEAFNL